MASLYLGWTLQPVFAAPVITNMPHRADGSRITGSQPVPKTMPEDVAVKTKPPAQTAPKPAAESAQTALKAEAPKQATQTTQSAPKPVTPSIQTAPKTEAPKQATPPAQTAPKTEAPKPVTPKAEVPKSATPKTEAPKPVAQTAQATPKTEAPKQATPPAQTAPKKEAPKQATPKAEAPKPVTPPAQTAPKTEAPKQTTQTTPKPAAQTAPKTEASKSATPKAEAPKPAVKSAPAALPTKPPGLETKKPAQSKPATQVKKEKAKKPAKPEPEKSVYKVGDKGWKIKQAQQYLQKLGFEPGETDGRFTKATRKAIRKFQKKYNLKETGNLDNATYNELKWQTEAKEYGGNVASTKILKTAAQYKGVPYVFGGTTPAGFDCSGYVQYVFAKNGIRLTRTADTQALEGKFVSKKNLKPGDLVFFTTYEPGASHVGIYAGNQKFWNATSSRGIMLSDLNDSYWGPRYYTARRILTGNDRSR
ncbi:MAG: NlpC/P60 family protein [Succiniclasticum sp.]